MEKAVALTRVHAHPAPFSTLTRHEDGDDDDGDDEADGQRRTSAMNKTFF